MSVEFTMVQTIGFAVLLLALGRFLRARVYFFERFAIPSAVIGGFLFALVNLVLHSTNIVNIQFDTTLQSFFMVLFFTSIGFGASPRILRMAGPLVLKFLMLAALLCVLQNAAAIALAPAVGVDSGIALMTGSTPMTGGHGTSAGIAPLLEKAGITGAESVAYTAATYGLIAGSLMGGPLAEHLIRRFNLLGKEDMAATVKLPRRGKARTEQLAQMNGPIPLDSAVDSFAEAPSSQSIAIEAEEILADESKHLLSSDRVLRAFIVMLAAMFFGSYITQELNEFVARFTDKASFPAYLGPMLFGVLGRWVSDKWSRDPQQPFVPHQEIEVVGTVSLNLFLSMALMSVQLWQLAKLAIPMLVLLFAQTVLMVLFARYITFPLMGKNYDAVVLMAGHCGFGMGATPNGMANMESLVTKHRPSKMAFFVLPVVGGMFIDFVNIIIITVFISFV